MRVPCLAGWLLLIGQVAHAACEAEAALSAPEMKQEWQRVRQLRGHFDGQAWRAEIDSWQGRKHCLMQVWQRQLTALASPDLRYAPNAHLLQLFDPPDLYVQHDLANLPSACIAVLHNRPPLQAGHKLAWYSWRGSRDGLLMLSRQNMLQEVVWCMSLE